MATKFINIFAAITIACSQFACEDVEDDAKKYISKCAENSYFFSDKALKVKDEVLNLGGLDEYLVLKHGAASEPFYNITLLGVKNGKGVLLYMDHGMAEPTVTSIDFSVVKTLIGQGENILSEDMASEFYTHKVHGIPCYFFDAKIEGNFKNFAFAGRTNNKAINAYIRRLEYLTLNIDRGPEDNQKIFYKRMHANTVENIFDELSALKENQ